MAKMGIKMIEMYCDMVKEQFKPILAEFSSREIEIKHEIEIQVKKQLGIYDLYLKKAELKAQLHEVESQLSQWETRRNTPSGWLTPVEERVAVLLEKTRNGLRKDVEKELENIIYSIKLSGVDSDIKSVFDKLPGTIAGLTKKLAKLPMPDVKKLAQKKS